MIGVAGLDGLAELTGVGVLVSVGSLAGLVCLVDLVGFAVMALLPAVSAAVHPYHQCDNLLLVCDAVGPVLASGIRFFAYKDTNARITPQAGIRFEASVFALCFSIVASRAAVPHRPVRLAAAIAPRRREKSARRQFSPLGKRIRHDSLL